MAKEMKTCIKEFLKHVETLEGEEDPDGCGFNREYRLIHELQIKNRRENVFKNENGKEEQNLKKNRYKDILPYDEYRVILNVQDGEDKGSDYINASYIMGVKGSGGYIATQGPLAATVNDFWRMIWEKDIEIVFMACRIVEVGKIKCKQYWNDVDTSDEFGDITVYTVSEENMSSDFSKRLFRVTRGGVERSVIQYHYSGWPDHGIPDDPDHIRDLIALMRQSRKKVEVPLLVHCSAGCGRTGAIIAIDYVWTLLEEGKLDENFSLYELICKFREQRMSIVQTPDQYALVYRVLKSLCEDWITKMASHTYVNVDVQEHYVNIGSDDNKQEEHIYEDSKSLVENMNNLKANETDQKTRTSPTANNDKQSEPETQSPTKVKSSTSNDSYANVDVINGRLQVSPSNSSSKEAEDDKVLHKTVIQIGVAAKPSPTAGEKSQNEVVNLIKTDSIRRRGLSKSVSAPVPKASTSESVASGSVKKSSSLHDSGPKIVPVPDNPPEFDERLPRVRGPVPMPSHWNQA